MLSMKLLLDCKPATSAHLRFPVQLTGVNMCSLMFRKMNKIIFIYILASL